MEKKETIQEEIERLKKEGSKSLQYMLNDMEEILENTNNPRKKVSEEEKVQEKYEAINVEKSKEIKKTKKNRQRYLVDVDIDTYTAIHLLENMSISKISKKDVVRECVKFYVESNISNIESYFEKIKEKLNIKYPDE